MKLISEEYKKILQQIHQTDKWGRMAKNQSSSIKKLLDEYNIKRLLDYGSGWGGLKDSLPSDYEVIEYEPGIEEKSQSPEPEKFVVCIDVLEHIEPEYIENVLDDLQRVVLDKGFLTISCREAVRRLPNGKNAHLIVKPHTWWKDKLELRFNILTYEYSDSSEQCQVFLEKK